MPSEVDDDLALLDVMIEALDKVGRYTADGTPDQFMADTLVQDAVALNFLVVGEVAGDLSDATKAAAAMCRGPEWSRSATGSLMATSSWIA